jgi:hypothetical protein
MRNVLCNPSIRDHRTEKHVFRRRVTRFLRRLFMRFIPLFVVCVAALGMANAFACNEVSSSPNSTAYSSNVIDETPVNTSYDGNIGNAQYNQNTSYDRTVPDRDNYATPMYSDRKQEYSGGAYRNYPGDYDRRMDRDMEAREDSYSRREFSDRGDDSSGVRIGTGAGAEGRGAGVNVGTHGIGVNAH